MGVVKMGKKTMAMLIAIILLVSFSVSCAANQASPAPGFTLSDNTGCQVSLFDYKGQKAVLILFFNYNTGGPRDPLFQDYLAHYQGVDKLETLCVVNTTYADAALGQAQAGPGNVVPLRDEDGSVSQAFGANPDKLTLVLVDQEGRIRFREEVTSTADTNAELAEQIKQATR